jgi:hypothetical protein
VLAEAGVRAGERLRVEALGPGRIVLTRAERDRHALAISARTYAELLVEPLRAGGQALEADLILTADARWKGVETVRVVGGR